ncbi:MAG: D-alanyl-D-alanine carboxypeptidase/D-alanyl-D-alanine-endopeptidase [Candidatus Marinimicrobia bacterium]|nr:D-alanyl-D-alanine carboxypeptidase/D-alanyl-D-alanine-endopeptidase [Candidatus Neomarinimicrobiota bacterium]MDP6457585.1 D-alanyl-D-alanine carboxypeptidase/D-alanyl-D-alanine-endopeptidase [Candidatus Neomarinimicrobiota bacterium]MDP6594071.1 D-alanyl-D-alanine carboxypeptidase/D-alanyl-D-alanine-endopeptidase [Candidatus Neomarinimicrobiota bacterium]MDP6836950.1 D-alanyl-D-alanine carboxypeptidase/D-alanyl-D-alanine-endopeptidase [Candidatus Neomarinimicrobiota bacterium]
MILVKFSRCLPLTTTVLLLLASCSFQTVHHIPRITAGQKANIAKRIDAAAASVDNNLNLGVMVVSPLTGEVIYEHNADHLFIPASNVKLFTAAAALHFLGPHYRFMTKLYTNSKSENHPDSEIANLYLKGGGDPDLTDRELSEMVEQLQILGIKAIQGNIVVDNTLFDSDPWGPGWMWDEGALWYFAPIDAMNLNDNCVTVHVRPGPKEGSLPLVSIDPPTAHISIDLKATTVRANSGKNSLKVQRRWKTKENIIDITGEIPLNSYSRQFTRSVENPAIYAGTVLKELLVDGGITVGGLVWQDTVPADTVLLSYHRSEPLSESVKNFLKISDNLTGEVLVKTVGAITDSAQGTWANGLRAIKTFLIDEVGIDTLRMEYADGSGVSRYNLISPDQIVQLLLWAHDSFKIYPEFVVALPIGGADGSLEKRMMSENLQQKSRAKTGTLRGVSSLSGYLTSADNETLAFSIMMNGYTGDSDPYRELQDRIVAILTTFSRTN